MGDEATLRCTGTLQHWLAPLCGEALRADEGLLLQPPHDKGTVLLTLKIIPPDATSSVPLHSTTASRALESQGLAATPPFALMAHAGLAAARWVRALAPHASVAWIFAGPGNNGGDGLVLARWLCVVGWDVRVFLATFEHDAPPDAARAHREARTAGVPIFMRWPESADGTPALIIDALLGLGQRGAPSPTIEAALLAIRARPDAMVLALDVPTGVCPDTGRRWSEWAVRAQHTLSLLTLKPGLFTGGGTEHAGQVWFAPLLAADRGGSGCHDASRPPPPSLGTKACAELIHPTAARAAWPPRWSDQHKGSFGDVWVVGGARGMAGAAVLAGRAALAAGAGRVFVHFLGEPPGTEAAGHALAHDSQQPELMPRDLLSLKRAGSLEAATVVCGCGGGQAVAKVLLDILRRSPRLVLDADGLNAIAESDALRLAVRARADRGQCTILTPHPLEAARLLACTAAEVQFDRMGSAQQLAQALGAVVVLKGSGTVICAPDGRVRINTTGNARLATAGSGDVLAGWTAGGWAQAGAIASEQPQQRALDIAAAAVWWHGKGAEGIRTGDALRLPLTASEQIGAIRTAMLSG